MPGAQKEGVICLRLDGPDGEVIGYVPVDASKGERLEGTDSEEAALANQEFRKYTAMVEQVSGVHDLFFIFYGEGYEIETWQFQ